MIIKTNKEIIGTNRETSEETTYILPGTKCEVMLILGEEPNKYYLCESTLYKNVFVPIFKSQCEIIKEKMGDDILLDEEEFPIE